jgi:cytochrome c-type biogenesis protein
MKKNKYAVILPFDEGVIAFFSPCAFPMLPAYISYYLASKKEGIKNGLFGGLICAAGAIFILLLIGSIISFAGEEIGGVVKENTQNIEIAVAAIIIILGTSICCWEKQ